MIDVDEALSLVKQHAPQLPACQVALTDAVGCVLADDLVSTLNAPPFDKALMDGYAVLSSDDARVKQVIEEIAAGSVPEGKITAGTAARIMTGAPLPIGADAVVPLERTTDAGGGAVRLDDDAVEPQQHILRRGMSIRAGAVVLTRGTVVRPIEVAVAAEAGHGTLSVLPRPSVAILPTGSELVTTDTPPAPGQIRNSNGPMLAAAARQAGGLPTELGIARDDRQLLRDLIEAGLQADVLLISGGVSAGDYDLVPAALAEAGVRQVFHKIALRPGKPAWFGFRDVSHRKRTLVFGLPGNPVSSLVVFELLVRPAISALGGHGFVGRPRVRAQLAHDYEHQGGRAALLPAKLEPSADGLPQVAILDWHGSADLATLGRANGLVALPASGVHLAAGNEVDVMSLGAAGHS